VTTPLNEDRNMIRKLRRASPGTALVALLGLAATPPASADWESMALDDMIATATYVAIAKVVDVVPGASAGEELATLVVTDPLKGNPQGSFVLEGAERDPSRVDFESGQYLVVFWNDGAPGAPGVVVGRDQGASALTPAQFAPTAALIDTVIARGANLRFAHVMQFLQRGEPRVPRPVLAALLEQLEGLATLQDRSAIGALACRPDDFQRQAADLGIALVGLLGVEEARQCLERHAQTPQGGHAIEAVEALGNFADPRSAQALLALIPALPPKAFEQGTDPIDGTDGPGPANDPEDDGFPMPDPIEDGDQDPPAQPPEDPIGTGIDEPDDDVSEDDDANGEGPLPPGANEEDDDAPFDSDDPVARMADGGLAEATVLALGKIGDPAAVSRIARIAREGNVLGLHSTVVNALGLIGDATAQRELRAIAQSHPHPLVRKLAQQTLQRLG
jgi:hypothetical protein